VMTTTRFLPRTSIELSNVCQQPKLGTLVATINAERRSAFGRALVNLPLATPFCCDDKQFMVMVLLVTNNQRLTTAFPLLHHLHEILKQIVRVVRAGRRFR